VVIEVFLPQIVGGLSVFTFLLLARAERRMKRSSVNAIPGNVSLAGGVSKASAALQS
jgi:hypothetical protein